MVRYSLLFRLSWLLDCLLAHSLGAIIASSFVDWAMQHACKRSSVYSAAILFKPGGIWFDVEGSWHLRVGENLQVSKQNGPKYYGNMHVLQLILKVRVSG